jgi:hypothetical protein
MIRINKLYPFFALLLCAIPVSRAQNLVQSYIEINTYGNSGFGYSVSTAGDVNSDGYDDVIAGAYGYNSYTGRAYIYYGGSSMDNTADVTLTGEVTNNRFGYSVSTAGDVDNDGYDDVIVGASGYNSYTGRAYIYYGGSSMDNTANVTLTGEGTGNYFGYSVSTAGDVNNDGYDDVIVGAHGYNSFTSSVYIYYGGGAMDNTVDVTLAGEATGNYFGYSVSTAGDINNDGYDDIIVGAYEYNASTGRAYIYYGGSAMDNTADVTLTGEATNNYFGNSVSTAGDVNKDGYGDVIVGAYGYNLFTGRAYIYYGGSVMDNTSDVTLGEATGNNFGISVSTAGDVNNDGYDDVIVGAIRYNSSTGRAFIYNGGSIMDNTADVTLTGEATSNYYGISVSSAGDVNNDGYCDVIVGASWYNSFTGRAYIYYGGSAMNNTADVTLNGEATSNYFGFSVSTVGDVNNDGYDDVIAGAYGYNSYTGRAYIYYGGSSMDNTADVTLTGEANDNQFGFSVSMGGDVNNDGYDDVIVGAHGYNSFTGRAYIYYGGSAMDNTADVTLSGEATSNYFGFSVSTAGDVNNDSYDDVIVGAISYNSYTGRAYIYYGGSAMNNTADVILTGEATNNYFGNSVSPAGDINNDGYSDVIVGAVGYQSFNGRAYIYYGSNSMDNTADVTLTGDRIGDFFGNSVSTAGDVNNDGYDDIIVGASWYNSFTGRAYIYYGGSAMNNTADVTLTGEATNNYFGFSVSTAGDVNNDGYNDVIVGAYNYPNNGKTYLYDLSLISGINESAISANDINIYPNPVKDILHVKNASGKTLKIYNIQGTEQMVKVLESSDESIMISTLPVGLYLVEVGNQKVKLVKK